MAQNPRNPWGIPGKKLPSTPPNTPYLHDHLTLDVHVGQANTAKDSPSPPASPATVQALWSRQPAFTRRRVLSLDSESAARIRHSSGGSSAGEHDVRSQSPSKYQELRRQHSSSSDMRGNVSMDHILAEISFDQEDDEKLDINVMCALLSMWIEDGADSHLAFEALLRCLEVALQPNQMALDFNEFIIILGSHSVRFLQASLPRLIDSDFNLNTDLCDYLLMNLAMFSTKFPQKNLLKEFVQTTKHFGGFYLRQHGKKFSELYKYIHWKQKVTVNDTEITITMYPHYLVCMHYPAKKVIVSNAPPVKLKRRNLFTRHKFECEMSAGGLVSGIKPSLSKSDVWVSYLESQLLHLDKMSKSQVTKIVRKGVRIQPQIRNSGSLMRYTMTEPDSHNLDEHEETLYEKAENDFESLQKRLDRFAEHNFIVNPLIIIKDEHQGFYNGISNGLFWPAFHNLPQHIIEEYKGQNQSGELQTDWLKYVQVNQYFAIHAARSCRRQDFLWIHDYHLFLVGDMLRSLDPTLDCGFFLHIPFRLSEDFMKTYKEQGLAVLKGLMGFHRVGFQCNRDTENFIVMIERYFPSAIVTYGAYTESIRLTIQYEGNMTDVGTFPISIKTSRILELSSGNEVERMAKQMRNQIMQGRQGKLFLSVERFDYTKGLIERMQAIELYLEQHPERADMDVFYQIAASSRADVSSYKIYQQQVLSLADRINSNYGSMREDGTMRLVVIIDQKNHPQEEVMILYKAADTIVVTPAADGMNLVVKEAILCNANACFILSTGAGAEGQLRTAGLHPFYIAIEHISDIPNFANQLYNSVLMDRATISSNGQHLFEFTKKNDIDHWIESFTSPEWTNVVFKPDIEDTSLECKVRKLQGIRGKIVDLLDKDGHIKTGMRMSLQNCVEYFARIGNEGSLDCARLSAEIAADLDLIVRVQQDACDWVTEADANEILLPNSASTDFVVIQWEDILANIRDIGDQYTLQSVISGFVFYRFLARLTSNLIIVSRTLKIAELHESCIFPDDFGILLGINGACVQGTLMYFEPFDQRLEKIMNFEMCQDGIFFVNDTFSVKFLTDRKIKLPFFNMQKICLNSEARLELLLKTALGHILKPVVEKFDV